MVSLQPDTRKKGILGEIGNITIGHIINDKGELISINKIKLKWNSICADLLHLRIRRKKEKSRQMFDKGKSLQLRRSTPQKLYVLHLLILLGNKREYNVYSNSLSKGVNIIFVPYYADNERHFLPGPWQAKKYFGTI